MTREEEARIKEIEEMLAELERSYKALNTKFMQLAPGDCSANEIMGQMDEVRSTEAELASEWNEIVNPYQPTPGM